MKTLWEYATALQADILLSKDILNYPVPQVDHMIRKRLELQNAVASTKRWTKEILEINSVEELMFVNLKLVKHGKPHISRDQEDYEQHGTDNYPLSCLHTDHEG